MAHLKTAAETLLACQHWPDELADTVLMLIDGANARVLVAGDHSAIHRAKAAATRLIEASDPA